MGELFGSSVKSLLQQDPPPLHNEAELLHAVVQKVGPFADRGKLCYHIRISAGKVHWAVNSYFRSILASAWPAREDFDSKPSSSSQQATAHSREAPAHAAAVVAAAAAANASLSNLAAADAVPAAAAAAVMPDDTGQHAQHVHCISSRAFLAAREQPAAISTRSGRKSEHSQLELSLLSDCPAGATHCCAVTDAAAAAAAADAAAAMHLDALPSNALECVLSYLDLPSLLNAAASCKALHRAAQAERLWRQLFLQRWGSVIFPTSKHSCRVGSGTVGSIRSGLRGAGVGMPTVYGGNATVGAGTVGAATAAAAAAAAVAAGAAVKGKHGCTDTAGSRGQHQAAAAAATAAGLRAAGEAASGGVAEAGSSSAGGRLHSRQAPADAASSSSSNAFVSRWTGSCLAGAGPAGTNSSSTPQPTVPQLSQHHQQLSQQRRGPAAVSSQRAPLLQSASPVGHTAGTKTDSCACSCSSCTALPASAPSGSWRLQYKQQHSYQAVRCCPKCGDATVVPIVYGFPSGPLLAGMGLKRLVLGGDHLIESCHVWACSGCRSCFRFYPYADVQLWLQDDEAQQRFDQARAAAGRSSGRRGAAADSGDGGQQQIGGEAVDLAQADAAAAAAGFPRYMYEL